jgi:Tol biopolymer transport system component
MGFSPDGQWAATIDHPAHPEIVLVPLGPGTSRRIEVPPGLSLSYLKWMPDGQRLLLTASEKGHGTRLYTLALASGSAPKPHPFTPEGAGRLGWNAIGPDEKVVASVNSGTNDVLLYPLDGSAPRPVPGVQPGELPVRFSDDGRYLWVLWRSGLPARVSRIDTNTGYREPWKELAPQDRTGAVAVNSVVLTPDGVAYAYSVEWRLSELYVADHLK